MKPIKMKYLNRFISDNDIKYLVFSDNRRYGIYTFLGMEELIDRGWLTNVDFYRTATGNLGNGVYQIDKATQVGIPLRLPSEVKYQYYITTLYYKGSTFYKYGVLRRTTKTGKIKEMSLTDQAFKKLQQSSVIFENMVNFIDANANNKQKPDFNLVPETFVIYDILSDKMI